MNEGTPNNQVNDLMHREYQETLRNLMTEENQDSPVPSNIPKHFENLNLGTEESQIQ